MPVAATLLPVLAAIAGLPAESSDDPARRVATAREGIEVFSALGVGPIDALADVHDRLVDGPHGPIPVRVYRRDPTATRPAVMYFHGGGFVAGNLGTHDVICRRLAKASGAVVVSVDYRLAPEHRFAIPLDDCHAATSWVAAHGEEITADGGRLAVAGDSAGGNLAAAVALRSRVAGPTLAAQVLVYPCIDAACAMASYAENGEGYLLTAAAMRDVWEWYLGPDGDPTDPLASVLDAPDLSGLPPTLIQTAEYDPLRDEGEEYGRRLDAAGVGVTVHRYDGMIHGFLGLRELVPESDAAMTEIVRFLDRHLGR
jgi:acetyl esterase